MEKKKKLPFLIRKTGSLIGKIIGFVPGIVILFLLVLFISPKLPFFEKGEERILTSATLKEAIDISELSTAQFTYNGIAEIFDEEDRDRIKCHVRYEAKVKAGIDMREVDFSVDTEKKTVSAKLPEIKITSNTVDDSNLSFIPDNTKAELKEVLLACEKDAREEAEASEKLTDLAVKNLQSVIEGLIYPIISEEGYRLVWE